MDIKRGDIVLVNLPKPIGSIQGGEKRACVVIQNNIGNHFSPTTIIAPFTTKVKNENQKTHVKVEWDNVNMLNEDSVLMLEQIMTIDVKEQAVCKIGKLKREYLGLLDKAIMVSLGL